jgi:Ca2+/Na+ antiporter
VLDSTRLTNTLDANMSGGKEARLSRAGLLVLGVLCGIIGCLPPAFLFEQALKPGRRVKVSEGLRSILISFVMLTVAILTVWLVVDDDVLQFGCAMVMTFLLFWAIESLRGWRATNDKTPTNERKG